MNIYRCSVADQTWRAVEELSVSSLHALWRVSRVQTVCTAGFLVSSQSVISGIAFRGCMMVDETGARGSVKVPSNLIGTARQLARREEAVYPDAQNLMPQSILPF
jgi:hypothetical protein